MFQRRHYGTLGLALVVLAVAGAATWLFADKRGSPQSEAMPTDTQLAGERTSADRPRRPSRPASASADAKKPDARVRSNARTRRDTLLDDIRRAREAFRTAHDSRYRAEVDGPGLDEEYVQERLKSDLIPGARYCYNQVLLADPDYSGKLVMDFSIVADENLGGVVEEIKLGDDTDIDDAKMLECLEETMYEMSFDPPREGGSVRVEYPLEFEPG